MTGWAEPDPASVDPPPDRPDSDPGDEPVEWVAVDGSVIEIVDRRRMRADGLRHRCTYVVVVVGQPDHFARSGSADRLSPDTEVIVHRRADWKDVAPGLWDLAFGGVCGVGEGWSRSARRELAEEAGIVLGPDDPLIELGPTFFRDEADDRPGAPPPTEIVGRVFLAAWPDRPVSTDGEAVAFDRVPLGRLGAWMATVAVCPDSAAVVAPTLLARMGQGPAVVNSP